MQCQVVICFSQKCVETFSVPQPRPARKARTRVHRPPEPGNPATPLPKTAKTERPSTRKDRFITMCFWETESRHWKTYRLF